MGSRLTPCGLCQVHGKQKQNGGDRLQCLGGEVRVTPDALAIVLVCMS